MTKYTTKDVIKIKLPKEEVTIYAGLILEIENDGMIRKSSRSKPEPTYRMKVRSRSNPEVVHTVSHQGPEIKFSGKVLDDIKKLLTKKLLTVYDG